MSEATALPAMPVMNHAGSTLNFDALRKKLKPEAWKLAPGFEHEWKNQEAGRKAEYRKNPFGNVELRGVIASGKTGESAFILPVGYRPKEEKNVLASAQEAKLFGRIAVKSTGEVVPENGTGEVKVFVYLDPMSFSVE